MQNKELFTARNKTLSDKIKEITAAIKERQKSLFQLQAAKENQTALIPKIKNILEIYDTLSPEQKNKMLKEVLDHVVYHKETKGTKTGGFDNFTLKLFPKVSEKS